MGVEVGATIVLAPEMLYGNHAPQTSGMCSLVFLKYPDPAVGGRNTGTWRNLGHMDGRSRLSQHIYDLLGDVVSGLVSPAFMCEGLRDFWEDYVSV